MNGHTSFIYSVHLLSTGEIVSSGEDRTVRVWKNGQCIQTLQQPCISVWTVSGLPNDDIVVGGSDATVRVYTRNEERVASPEALKEFDELLASQAIPSNQLGDSVNKENLPGPEALQKPGNKEGQVLMVNMGATVEAHQWSNNTWQKIGEVVGSSGGSKQSFEGKEYDYVFDIDVGAGANLKLPYNVTQNPYDAAQKFLLKNELPQSFMDQVADFIIKNAEGVNLGSTYQDPFTGGNRYTPAGSNPSAGAGATYQDPFTGSGSYRPGNTASSLPATTTYQDPFTGGGSYKTNAAAAPIPQQPKVLPIRSYLTLKQANPDAVLNKIRAFNEEVTESKLSEKELEYLSSSVVFLKNPTSSKNDDSGLLAVIKMATQWPADKRFPALDLVRLFALYAPEELASALPDRNIAAFLLEAGGLSATHQAIEINAMLAYRGLANLFNTDVGRQLIWERRSIVADMLQVDVSGKFKGKAARLAISTLAVK